MSKKSPFQFDLFPPTAAMVVEPGVADVVSQAVAVLNQYNGVRIAAMEPSSVYALLSDAPSTSTVVPIYGHYVNISNLHHRFKTFEHSPTCVCCGRTGNVVLVEIESTNPSQRTINLYSVSKSSVVLMTVDHILPDSLGGKYHKSNFQTMCKVCNQQKRNIMTLEEVKLVRENPAKYAKTWVDEEILRAQLEVMEAYHNPDLDVKQKNRILNDVIQPMTKHTSPKATKTDGLESARAIRKALARAVHKGNKANTAKHPASCSLKTRFAAVMSFLRVVKSIMSDTQTQIQRAYKAAFRS